MTHADDRERFAAHVGISYAIDDISYRSLRAIGANKIESQVLSAITTMAIGLAYKKAEGAGGAETLHSSLENAVGVGAASVVHLSFDW